MAWYAVRSRWIGVSEIDFRETAMMSVPSSGSPTGPRPDTSRPYVMWAGTPYAHLMIHVR